MQAQAAFKKNVREAVAAAVPGLFSRRYSPVENVWAYLRANKLAITVFDTYDAIVDACCTAWNFFANDPKAIASITSRTWAEIS